VILHMDNMRLFQLWCKLPQGAWQRMTYAPRERYKCDHVIRIYRERFGHTYEYTVMPCGMNPPGVCVQS